MTVSRPSIRRGASAPWPLTCAGCGRHLGDTDGRLLYLGTCWFARSVTLHCLRCGQRFAWSPSPGHGPEKGSP